MGERNREPDLVERYNLTQRAIRAGRDPVPRHIAPVPVIEVASSSSSWSAADIFIDEEDLQPQPKAKPKLMPRTKKPKARPKTRAVIVAQRLALQQRRAAQEAESALRREERLQRARRVQAGADIQRRRDYALPAVAFGECYIRS